MLLIILTALVAALVDATNVPVARTSLAAAADWVAAPAPTPAPAVHPDLFKRGLTLTSVCGYEQVNASISWHCAATNYCGFNTALSAFGCCAGQDGTSLTDCNFITTCYDSAAFFASCGTACQSNSLVGWCTSAIHPYCYKYYETGFTGYDCGPTAGLTLTLDYYSPAPTGTQSTTTTPSSAANSASASASASVGGGGDGGQVGGDATALHTTSSPTIVPFTQTTSATASTSSSSGGSAASVDQTLVRLNFALIVAAGVFVVL